MGTLNEEFAKLRFACVASPCSRVIDSSVPKDDGAANLLKHKSEHSSNDAVIKDLNLVEHYKTMSVGSNKKKIAPTVPPKPQKNVKLPESDYSLSNNLHLLHRKQSTLGSGISHNKLNAFSLDNPAILEQQLEALAHHKMQLERKGILQKVPEQFSTFRDSSNHSGATKEFSSSFPNEPKINTSSSCLMNTAPCPDYTHTIYSNICTAPILPNNIYADTNSFNTYTYVILHNSKNTLRKIVDESKPRSSVDHNTHSKKYSLDDLSSPLTALNIGTDDDYLKTGEVIIAPSPVSSSYSELHRATDIFSKMPVLTTVPKKEVSQNSNSGLIIGAKANSLSYPKFNENPNVRNCDIPIAGVYQNYTNENVNFNDNLSLQCVQRISQGSSDYYGFGSFSQGSSTYESIYEPINPRPSSQLSAQSNCLMYPQYANSPQTCEGIANNSGNALSLNAQCNPGNSNLTVGVNSGFSTKNHVAKEPEIQALTDFLVDSTNDVYSYGVCVKCNERVLGENSGCTAMDQVYHISCFTCTQCQVNLQGKPFYALECKPYCEYDYLQTLEKCSICMKPILERILRATGKPYHPQCFTCVVCGNSLDGIPFTVDAINQNYCIADFHKKFAPRCCVCEQPIMPEPGQEETIRVVALDRSFHFDCYKCEDCGLLLSSEAEGRGCYPLDDHVLCKSCNAKRVQLLTTRMTTEL